MKIPILAVAAVAALLAFSAPAYAASDQSYESIIDLGAQAPLTLLDNNQTLGAGHIDVATAVMDVDIDRDATSAYTEFIYSAPALARIGDEIYIQRDLQTYGFADGHLAGSDLGLTTNRGADDFTEQI